MQPVVLPYLSVKSRKLNNSEYDFLVEIDRTTLAEFKINLVKKLNKRTCYYFLKQPNNFKQDIYSQW